MPTQVADPVVRVSSVVTRMDNIAAELRQHRASLPRWALVRRARIDGALTLLRAETDTLLELAAKCQPIIGAKVRG